MLEMQSSKICFNHSMNYNMNGSKNINAKFFEIMGSGTFMLSNYVEDLFNFFDKNEDVEKMLFRDEEELSQKINFYLKNDLEREKVSKKVFDYIYNNHTYENRAKLIIDKFKEFYS
jgi:spore maturation protein CgeB